MRYAMQKKPKKVLWLLALVTLTFALSPAMVGAQDCFIDGIPDDDCDGFHNNIEETCISLGDNCYNLDPNRIDAFIAIDRLSASYIPNNVLDLLSDPNQFNFNVIEVPPDDLMLDGDRLR